MDKLIAFSNQTEARDKFTRAIQYSARFISWSLIRVDVSLYRRFYDLFKMTRDSRKIFRLFKSLQEIKIINDKIKDLLWKKEKTPVIFEIFSRIGYLIHWVFDNFFILATVKVIKADNLNFILNISHIGWIVGILWGLMNNLYELFMLLFVEKKTDSNSNCRCKQKKIISRLIRILGQLSDLIPATAGTNFPRVVLGRDYSEGLIGVTGVMASVVSMWTLWNEL